MLDDLGQPVLRPMLKIGSVRWKGRCAKHPRYDPDADGLGGIRGGCRRCEMLLEIHGHHSKMVRLIREFGTREEPKSVHTGADHPDHQMTIFDVIA
jgi:hypothetical protein